MKEQQDIEQMSPTVTWFVIGVLLLLGAACGGGLVLRVFLWMAGISP